MITPTSNCYGCRACEQVCAHKAITMQPNDEGFLFPIVDRTKCVDCGLCDRVCAEEATNVKNVLHPTTDKVYAAWNRSQEVVRQSTSGGLSATIAQNIIAQGGVVYGCAWRSESDLVAVQTRITTSEELYRIKGSKYVQSDTEDSYKQVKSDLKNGLTVLYTGTPCQIAGLRLYLRKAYDNLITIDLVCHGVPSPKMFKSYIEWLERKSKTRISRYKFRDQRKGSIIYHSWKQGNKEQKQLLGLVPYSVGFYNSYISRESCFQCAFSQAQRVGDITLSDFWGAGRHHKELKQARKHGFNLVMCNTSKGEKIIETVKESLHIMPSKLEYAVQGDIRLRKPDPRPAFRDNAYKILNEKGFDHLQKNHLRPKYYYMQLLMPTWVRVLVNKIRK